MYRDVLKQARSAYYSNLIAEWADCPTLITFIAGKLTNLALPTSTELCELFTSHFENKIKIIVSQLPSNEAANTNNSAIPNLKPVTILKLQILLAFYAPTPQGAIMFCQIFGLNSYSFS